MLIEHNRTLPIRQPHYSSCKTAAGTATTVATATAGHEGAAAVTTAAVDLGREGATTVATTTAAAGRKGAAAASTTAATDVGRPRLPL